MVVMLDYINRYRPPFAEGETVTLALNGRPLATELPDSGHARRLTARIPTAALAAVVPPRLSLSVPTWSPAEVARNDDKRELGSKLDRLQYEPAGQSTGEPE